MQTVTGLCGTVDVRGRGALVAEISVSADGITLRLDDDHRDEWWAEVSLPVWQLKALVRRIEAERGAS